jgi:dTDP-3-amino-2,3,6-trideoxy-4-keto-D-glucose/dTDP-3-amino-3,4,6-trideoxy-alpha-D-glucose/dTDP-2,6-dideoxy-D-kanosamine transaminase
MLINDLSLHIQSHEAEIKLAIDRVLTSGWVVLGPEVKKFEQSFAEYVGVSQCVTVANGTDAIELGLKALGVKSGDLVATVANAGMYTTSALLAIGAIPFFMDVSNSTRNVYLSEVENAISKGVKAVVATHLYGFAIEEIAEIVEMCKRAGVAVLEDCAQAHGARIGNKCVGSFGDAAAFSFYPTKNLGALGDGGAVVTGNLNVADQVAKLRQYGWASKYKVETAGARNSRLDEIQAAILSVFLLTLDKSNEKRRAIARIYNEQIVHPQVTLPMHDGKGYVAHLFVLQSKHRNALQNHLKSLGIASDIHYPVPDHLQPIFGNKFSSIKLANTERLSSEVLTIPCYPEMKTEQIRQVVSAINSWQI